MGTYRREEQSIEIAEIGTKSKPHNNNKILVINTKK
jgi:hypothetical protein